MNDPRISEIAEIAALVTVDKFFPEAAGTDLLPKLATAFTAAIETYLILHSRNDVPAGPG